MTIQIQDPFITTLFKTNFYNDTSKFVEAIKELFQTKAKLETQEYNLLKAYDRGELSLGQVATILNLSKEETMELLQKYDIVISDTTALIILAKSDAFSLLSNLFQKIYVLNLSRRVALPTIKQAFIPIYGR